MDRNIPIIGVMGSGSDPHEELAAEVADILVRFPASLLTGGGAGVMRSVSRCYVNHPLRTGGVCIGIIPCQPNDPTKPKPGYPNPFVEIPIFTHLPLSGPRGTELGSRNHINVLTPTAIIALPGADGTISEIKLAISYRKPIVAYSFTPEQVAHFPASIRRIHQAEVLASFLSSVCPKISP